MHNIFLVIIFLKKGGPVYLISFWKRDRGEIGKGILFRRSKKIDIDSHWNDTRLGEISTNWSYLCKSPKDVLYDSSEKNLLEKKSTLINEDKRRVYSCNLDSFVEEQKDNYPFNKTIEFQENTLRINIIHNKTLCNYAHADINCYLTTKDGEHINELVGYEEWNKHPLNKKYKGLRNLYKVHLIYHFSEYEDFD